MIRKEIEEPESVRYKLNVNFWVSLVSNVDEIGIVHEWNIMVSCSFL